MRRKFKFDRHDPQPRAVCDRCGLQVSRQTLRKQTDFRGGDAPVDTGLLVCVACFDEPQPYYARAKVGRDPEPVKNPRPGNIS